MTDDFVTLTIERQKNIALIAHDSFGDGCREQLSRVAAFKQKMPESQRLMRFRH